MFTLQDRIVAGMNAWKELRGPHASLDDVIRVLHVIHMDKLSDKLKTMRILSQAIRF